MYQKIAQRVRALLRDDEGPTAVEYAVLIALIIGACMASVGTLTVAMKSNLNSSATAINGVLSP